MSSTLRQTSRRQWLASSLVLAAAAGLLPMSAWSFDDASDKSVNVDASGVALKGHDPVSYFEAGRAEQGSQAFEAKHGGATYRFTTAAHRDAFLKKPEAYAPAYGGFCAMGAALGKKFDIDPQAFRVVDGRLFLNLNKDVQQKWAQDTSRLIREADATWPKVSDKAPNAL